jgi:3-dehydroquinate dehydratase-1
MLKGFVFQLGQQGGIMRPLCRRPFSIRGREIGGRHPLACLPLVAADLAGLLDQARAAVLNNPDLLEWRIDGFAPAGESEPILAALSSLRQAIGDTPLILTCRSVQEGGIQAVPLDERVELLESMLQTGLADIVDFEISSGEAAVSRIVQAVRSSQAKLILSFHDFQRTPEPGFMIGKLAEAERLGADIAKLAVMPQDYQDVIDLLGATLKARSEVLAIPVITIAMGEIGRLTRIAGALFGSDISFALGQQSSAPGQIPVDELRQAWKSLAL